MSEWLLTQTNLNSSAAALRISNIRRGHWNKLVCLVDVNLSPPPKHNTPLFDMTKWNLNLILSSGYGSVLPIFHCRDTIDFRDVRMRLNALIPHTVSCYLLSGSYWDVGMNGYEWGAWLCAVGRACCESCSFSDRDHSLRCGVCPMNSAQHPGITMRAEQFWKINKPLELSVVSFIEKWQHTRVYLCLFLFPSISFYKLFLFSFCFYINMLT